MSARAHRFMLIVSNEAMRVTQNAYLTDLNTSSQGTGSKKQSQLFNQAYLEEDCACAMDGIILLQPEGPNEGEH